MDLFKFISQPDPFKVKTGERTLKEGEPTLRAETADRVIEPSENVVSLVQRTVVEEIADAKARKKAGKRKVTIIAPSKPSKKRLVSLATKETGGDSGIHLFFSSCSAVFSYFFLFIYSFCYSRCCACGDYSRAPGASG